MKTCVILSAEDNIGTLLEPGSKGEEFRITDTSFNELGRIVLLADVPGTHKIAVKDIPEGGNVVKYSEIIGRASAPIRAGEYAHVHNIVSIAGTHSE